VVFTLRIKGISSFTPFLVQRIELVNAGAIQERIEDLVTQLRNNGRNPYVVPAGAFTPSGTVGYVKVTQEIYEQLKEKRITAQYVFVTVGTGGTTGGLLLGAKYLQAPFQITGANIGFKKEGIAYTVVGMANETAKLLDMDLTLTPDQITIYDNSMGDGYGVPTVQCIEAIKLVAQTEWIILGPVYTGKTMSGLIDLVQRGRFTSKDTIIFMHTGGAPGVFAYNNELSANLGKASVGYSIAKGYRPVLVLLSDIETQGHQEYLLTQCMLENWLTP